MSGEDYGFKQVEGHNDTYICVADADTRAVMGAKTSRAPNLQKRWEELMASNGGEPWPWGEPPETVSTFLDKNLKEYMHASIAEMAEVFVHARGIGWPVAWLIEDNPLFVGQEVSTRAVDVLKDSRHPSHYAPRMLFDAHYKWVELFEKLQAGVSGRGYKFDEIRWALPGTTRSGVTMCNKVRDGVRHLEQIAGLGGEYERISKRMIDGCKAYAPRATEAVLRGSRRPSSLWEPPLQAQDPDTIREVSLHSRVPVASYPPDQSVARSGPGEYLDPEWNFFGQFALEINCSVAAARDWHRHRVAMPWELSVCWDMDKNELVRSPHYDMRALDDPPFHGLWEETSSLFKEIYDDPDIPKWSALRALPFGAVVQLRCHIGLPALLYMLELRYSSKGANPEYREQAKQGLLGLATQLGPSITRREHILGVLSKADKTEQVSQ